jgi:glucosylceramidase
MKTKSIVFLLAVSLTANIMAQSRTNAGIESWITRQDRSELFLKSTEKIEFSDRGRGKGSSIVIDESHTMQSVDGFGFALTGGSAELMMKMSAAARKNLITDIFSHDGNHIGVSYLRISVGSSDLNSFVFSYDDLKDSETDFNLSKFDLGQDRKDVIPVLKEILEISPEIKILASPWSPPAWMKTNGKVKAGSLKPECYQVYAEYLVRYILEMKKSGIKIDAITIQNEPINANNTPSMRMSAAEQAEFIKKYLGPAFDKNGIETRIVVFDHNLDRPDYPLTIISDPDASKYIDGSGFHSYGGDMSAMTLLHTAYPDKNLYFTEQMVTEHPGSPTIEIASQVNRLIIGAMQNWSRNVILWNLAADRLNDPHTNDGGCSMCQGAVTLNGDTVTKNIAWYVVAHASKFVIPGSVRIGSTQAGDISVSFTTDEERREVVRVAAVKNNDILPNVSFKTPDGKIVLIVVNDTFRNASFRIQFRSKTASARLDSGCVGTYIWDTKY